MVVRIRRGIVAYFTAAVKATPAGCTVLNWGRMSQVEGCGVLISGERLFQNFMNRLVEMTVSGIGWLTVSLAQMTLNPRFHETALTVFEIGYNRSRREYDHAAGALQI